MGQKLNWGAAFLGLADALRTYAETERRKQEIAAERKYQEGRDKARIDEWTKAREADRLAERGPQLGEVRFSEPTGRLGGGGMGMPLLPQMLSQAAPVYTSDLRQSNLLGRTFMDQQGYGKQEPAEQTWPVSYGGETYPIDDAGQALNARLAIARLNRADSDGGGSPALDYGRLTGAVDKYLGPDVSAANRLGLRDDIIDRADELVADGMEMSQAIAKARSELLPDLTPERKTKLAQMLAEANLLPSKHLIQSGAGVTGRDEFRRGVVIPTTVEKKTPRWGPLKDKIEQVPSTDVVSLPEALGTIQAVRDAATKIKADGKVTKAEIAQFSDEMNLQEDEFLALLGWVTTEGTDDLDAAFGDASKPEE